MQPVRFTDRHTNWNDKITATTEKQNRMKNITGFCFCFYLFIYVNVAVEGIFGNAKIVGNLISGLGDEESTCII